MADLDDEPKTELRRILQEQPELASSGIPRIIAELRDLCGEHRLEIQLLETAGEEGAVEALTRTDLPLESRVRRFAARLEQEQGLSPESAEWAAASWAAALSPEDAQTADEVPSARGAPWPKSRRRIGVPEIALALACVGTITAVVLILSWLSAEDSSTTTPSSSPTAPLTSSPTTAAEAEEFIRDHVDTDEFATCDGNSGDPPDAVGSLFCRKGDFVVYYSYFETRAGMDRYLADSVAYYGVPEGPACGNGDFGLSTWFYVNPDDDAGELVCGVLTPSDGGGIGIEASHWEFLIYMEVYADRSLNEVFEFWSKHVPLQLA